MGDFDKLNQQLKGITPYQSGLQRPLSKLSAIGKLVSLLLGDPVVYDSSGVSTTDTSDDAPIAGETPA